MGSVTDSLASNVPEFSRVPLPMMLLSSFLRALRHLLIFGESFACVIYISLMGGGKYTMIGPFPSYGCVDSARGAVTSALYVS
jgi:hypothetical protein